MILVKDTAQRDQDTRTKTQKVHEVEDPQFPSLIASQGRLISDIPDISLQAYETLYGCVHGIRALGFARDEKR
jgi:hypothetical protein